MIKFVNASEIKKVAEKFDEILYITGTMKKAPSEKIKHVPELAPGKENKAGDRYFEIQFLREMRQNESMDKLNELYRLGKQKNILCVCYKNDSAHKNIVCGLLQGAYKSRNEAFVDENTDYSSFFTTYRKLKTVTPQTQLAPAIA